MRCEFGRLIDVDFTCLTLAERGIAGFLTRVLSLYTGYRLLREGKLSVVTEVYRLTKLGGLRIKRKGLKLGLVGLLDLIRIER